MDLRTTDPAAIETVGWDDHVSRWDWQQGEHVTLIGPTGCGKTHLTRAILPRREYVVFVATKPRDPIIDQLEDDGFHVASRWNPANHDRIVLHPVRRRSAAEDRRNARDEIGAMLDDLYVQGGWTVVLDELRYVTGNLGMSEAVELLWLQGRSLGVTVVSGAQRPRHVPLAAYSQARHLYVWRTRDRQDLGRLAEFSGELNPMQLGSAVSALPDHACLYANADGTLRRTGVGMVARRR